MTGTTHSTTEVAMVRPENPYVGPRSFEEKDAKIFFGREREARELLALVARERLVLFYAQSGAGKSSLLRARLVPALRDVGFEVLPIVRLAGILPEDVSATDVDNIFIYHLILNLNQQLATEADTQANTLTKTSLLAYLGGEEATKTNDVIEGFAPTVLIIDQFEEIMTNHLDRWAERAGFFKQLRQVLERLPTLWILLSLREDYLAPIDFYAEHLPNRLRARFYMQRMDVDAALEAVKQPAADYGHPFADGVAEELVNNLRSVRVYGQPTPGLGQYVEPVQLQVVCFQLWKNVTQATEADQQPSASREIQASDLPLNYIDHALRLFYEDALAATLAHADVQEAGVTQRMLRDWFSKELITEGGIRNLIMYNEDSGFVGTLPNVAVDQLVENYLLRTELRAGRPWVELVHDRYVAPILEANRNWDEGNNLYALLIGIDYYFPHQLSHGSYYPALAGCVRDVRTFEAWLTHDLSVPPRNIITLTSTNSGRDYPAEDPGVWPTYQNMIAAFHQLTATAQAGDQIYIHYSGHGGRTATAFPSIKGADGIDEVLVPTDIGSPDARYLHDVELLYLLNAMVNKGLQVTVVLDTCFTGGATRGVSTARIRSIPQIGEAPPYTDSLAAQTSDLGATWQQAVGNSSGIRGQRGWSMASTGYTLINACRPGESAYESQFDGRQFSGALSYWLLDTLMQADPKTTWKMVMDRVLAKVHGQFEQQTPVFIGEMDQLIFSSDYTHRPGQKLSIPVLRVEQNRVLLNAGEAHGVIVNRQFAIYPVGARGVDQAEARIALVQIVDVRAVESWAEIIETSMSEPIVVGMRAILIEPVVNFRLQRNVALVIADAQQRAMAEEAIENTGKGLIKVAAQEEQLDFQLAEFEGEYQLWDPAGVIIPNLQPPILIEEPDALTRAVERLVHLAKYRNVQELESSNLQMRGKLKVEFDGQAVNRPGDRLAVRITNMQKPNPQSDEDPSDILYITVLDLVDDWSITQIFPVNGAFQELYPGETIPLEFEAYLPAGKTGSTDLLKIFATYSATNFRWLELPALDMLDPLATAARGTITNPLEGLVAMVNAEEPTTRAVRLNRSDQDQDWTTAQIEFHVQERDQTQ